MVRRFTLEYWLDEDWYIGRLKEVPGIFSQGVSLEELEENIQDAYQLMMEEEAETMLPAGVQIKELEIEV
jgi:predicted RNase H-like HicB family nuclease